MHKPLIAEGSLSVLCTRCYTAQVIWNQNIKSKKHNKEKKLLWHANAIFLAVLKNMCAHNQSHAQGYRISWTKFWQVREDRQTRPTTVEYQCFTIVKCLCSPPRGCPLKQARLSVVFTRKMKYLVRSMRRRRTVGRNLCHITMLHCYQAQLFNQLFVPTVTKENMRR